MNLKQLLTISAVNPYNAGYLGRQHTIATRRKKTLRELEFEETSDVRVLFEVQYCLTQARWHTYCMPRYTLVTKVLQILR